MKNILGKVMAVFLITIVVFTVYSIWGMDESWNDIDNNKENTITNTDDKSGNQKLPLINLEDFLKVEIERETNGSVYVHAKDDNGDGFIYYGKLLGSDKEIANALGINEGQIVFINDLEREMYLAEKHQVFMTFKDASADQMKEEMDEMLERIGISFDELKEILKEEYKKSN